MLAKPTFYRMFTNQNGENALSERGTVTFHFYSLAFSGPFQLPMSSFESLRQLTQAKLLLAA